jgi:YidC/Oxa1 family membrane protein insertase
MKMDDDEQSGGGFFDKNTMIAIGLSFAVFFGWQTYLSKKYPKTEAPVKTETVAKGKDPNITPIETAEKPAVPAAAVSAEVSKKNIAIQTLSYNSDKIEVDFVNDGLGIKKLVLKEFSDRDGKTIEYNFMGTDAVLMGTQINGESLFDIKKTGENEFEGTLISNGVRATKRVVIDPNRYLISTNISVQFDERKKLDLQNNITSNIEKIEKTFLLPAFEHQEVFVVTTDEKISREHLELEKEAKKDFGSANIAAVNAPYFALAALNTSEILPVVSFNSTGQVANILVDYQSAEPKLQHEISYNFYFGPKKTELLSAVDESLKELVDYGMFAVIGRPLLAIMKVIYSFFQNWGVAIILLTILVKLVLFPLHMYSMKSMKKMQKIQPKLKEIKEKYKNDPQRVNQETILLMKTEKANPLSGCLPALMQFPIFIALYSMYGKSFELYKQPFIFWIHDLSAKDPYYVLPILAGTVFFAQMKLTPTANVDPAQAKVMMFMPLMITAFTLTVPSGLALYMFVNAVFSVLQQLLVTRDKTA